MVEAEFLLTVIEPLLFVIEPPGVVEPLFIVDLPDIELPPLIVPVLPDIVPLLAVFIEPPDSVSAPEVIGVFDDIDELPVVVLFEIELLPVELPLPLLPGFDEQLPPATIIVKAKDNAKVFFIEKILLFYF